MANLNFPMGFVPIKYLSGRDLQVEQGNIAAANEAIYINDLLERRSDGLIHPAQAGSTTLIGVAAEYKAANATVSTVLYYPLEGLVMKAQVSSTEIAVADLDLVYDITATTGDTTTKYSRMTITSGSGAATATLPIKVLKLYESKDREKNIQGSYMKVVCMANQGVTKGAGTVG